MSVSWSETTPTRTRRSGAVSGALACIILLASVDVALSQVAPGRDPLGPPEGLVLCRSTALAAADGVLEVAWIEGGPGPFEGRTITARYDSLGSPVSIEVSIPESSASGDRIHILAVVFRSQGVNLVRPRVTRVLATIGDMLVRTDTVPALSPALIAHYADRARALALVMWRRRCEPSSGGPRERAIEH